MNAKDTDARDILIRASDDEVNALAELIDFGVKAGGYQVARNAGFWVQRLEEAVGARNAQRQLVSEARGFAEHVGARPIPIRQSEEDKTDGAA